MRQQNKGTNRDTSVQSYIEFDNGEFHPAAMKIVRKGRKCWCSDKTGVTFREQNNHMAPVGEFMLL